MNTVTGQHVVNRDTLSQVGCPTGGTTAVVTQNRKLQNERLGKAEVC